MYHFLLLALLLGLGTGLIACVYAVILTEPQMLLSGLFSWLDKKLGPGSAAIAKQERERYLEAVGGNNLGEIKPRAMWLFKPLIGCPRCVAGQLGAWFYLLAIVTETQKYSIFGHVLCICVSIFAVSVYSKIYAWSRS